MPIYKGEARNYGEELPDADPDRGGLHNNYSRNKLAITVDMKTGFTGVQDRMELMRSEFVHRTEYDVRNEALDREIVQIRESVKSGVAGVEKKVDAIDSRRPQWTAVGAFVVAAAGLALSLLR